MTDADALAVLREIGPGEGRVFLYEGKPVKQVNTKAWRAAVQSTTRAVVGAANWTKATEVPWNPAGDVTGIM